MKKILNIIFPICYLLILVFFIFINSLPEFIFTLFAISVIILLTICAVMAIRAFGLKSAYGKVMLLLFTGIIIKVVSNIVLMSSGHMQAGIEPFPGFRLISLAGYLSILASFVIIYRQDKISWTIDKTVLNIGLMTMLVFLVVYFGMIIPDVFNLNMMMATEMALDLLLGIAAILIYSLVKEYQQGGYAQPWLFFLVSFILVLVADTLVTNYSEQFLQGVWPFVSIPIIGLLVFTLQAHGFFKFKKAIDEINTILLK